MKHVRRLASEPDDVLNRRPTLQDAEGHHSSALFVQWAPNRVAGSSWERESDRYADHLLDLCERFAPGTKALVKDRVMLHPEAIDRAI